MYNYFFFQSTVKDLAFLKVFFQMLRGNYFLFQKIVCLYSFHVEGIFILKKSESNKHVQKTFALLQSVP